MRLAPTRFLDGLRFNRLLLGGGLVLLGVLGLLGLTSCQFLRSSPSLPPPDAVTVLWAGGVTDTSARVTVRLPSAPDRVRLAVTSAAHWEPPTLYSGTRPGPSPEVRRFALNDLSPQTTYRYAVQVDGRLDTARSGRFRTFGSAPFSFRVALAACADTGSDHPVFHAIRQTNPDLFLHLGDLHYEDIGTAQPARFRTAFHHVHGAEPQAALFRSTALAYMWDDHDYGPNNSSRAAPGRPVAQSVYRAYVPHYPLARENEGPVYQAFPVGRIRFVLTDLRSARTPNDAPDSLRTMMGPQQKAWFKQQLRQARDHGQVVAWVSSVPWIADQTDAGDHWGGFAAERRELATVIDTIGMNDQLFILSGDAHMVALDDGTHNHYGRADGGGFPVIHAAALDRPGSVKGGPYTHGPYRTPFGLFTRRPGQFVVMDVEDDGDEVCVSWTGKRYAPHADRLTTLLDWSTCFSPS